MASNNVHYARPENGRLGAAVAAVRARRSLAEMDGWLPGPGAHLRSGAEMAQLFARYPGAVAQTVEVADQCAFDLQLAKPRLPKQRVPLGPHPDQLAARALPPRRRRALPAHPGGGRGAAAARS